MNFHSKRFGRAAETYDSFAEPQAQMAKKLLEIYSSYSADPLISRSPENNIELKKANPAKIQSILELGCGTGLLTEQLHKGFPEADILATDASDLMVQRAKERFKPSDKISFKILDAQGLKSSEIIGDKNLPKKNSSGNVDSELDSLATTFSLVASNAMVQWFPDLKAHFNWVKTHLEPKGYYLVSGFMQDNFPELNSLLREEPFLYSNFPGHEEKEIKSAVESAGFKLEFWMQGEFKKEFENTFAFLNAIKGLGSSRRPNEKPLTRIKMEVLAQRYPARYPSSQGIIATWKPWYALLKKA